MKTHWLSCAFLPRGLLLRDTRRVFGRFIESNLNNDASRMDLAIKNDELHKDSQHDAVKHQYCVFFLC